MSREVCHDGKSGLEVRFPFDRALVDLIKSLPNRRWNAADRHWFVPAADVVALVDLLREEGFRFDEATRACYRDAGGTADLQSSERAPRTTRENGSQRSLFGGDEDAAPGADGAVGADGDLSVAALNRKVAGVLDDAFPTPIWLIGEVANFNKNAHRRIVSFELVEPDDGGRNTAKVAAVLFERDRRTIEKKLAEAGGPFELQDEIAVRMRVRVSLYPAWGLYRVVVQDIDVHYTLGEAARRREEIVRRLAAAGYLERNPSLPWPRVPLRVGLITSVGSDAYNDVLRTLRESGFAFDVTVHGARVQGRATESTVLAALARLAEMRDRLDVVLICRGGGSRTDLTWFDSEPLGIAVADFPLPVLVGIGHEQDQSVLDSVARSAKTPTAAARVLVDEVRAYLDRIGECFATLIGAADRGVRDQSRRVRDDARRLAASALHRLEHESTRLGNRSRRTSVAARTVLARAGEQLVTGRDRLRRGARVHLDRERVSVDGHARTLAIGSQRTLVRAGEALARLVPALAPAAQRMLRTESERTGQRGHRLRLVDPQRVLERGYAILRSPAGGVVHSVGDVTRGDALSARVEDGTLRVSVNEIEPKVSREEETP